MIDEKLLARAKSNDADACNEVANYYFEGKNTPKDLDKAVYYYSIAANQGHIEAIYSLGYCYAVGDGVEKNISKW